MLVAASLAAWQAAIARRARRRLSMLTLSGLPIGAMIAPARRADARRCSSAADASIVSDTAQYYTGRAFGRGRSPRRSVRKKTIEGAVGGFVRQR